MVQCSMLSCLENIMLPAVARNNRQEYKKAYSRAVGLLEMVGLNDRIHQRPGQLSGGECQRVAVVRALINQPSVILADEPTGSLDQESAEMVGNLLADIHKREKVALITVTHSTEMAKKMNKMYILRNGQLEPANGK